MTPLDVIPLALGVILGGVTIAIAVLSRLAENRAAAPMVLMAIATFYVVFAVEARLALWTVTLTASLFVMIALIAYRVSLWIAVAGLALHAAYDFFGPRLGVASPEWWPVYCLTYDVVLAGAIGWWIVTGRLLAMPGEGS